MGCDSVPDVHITVPSTQPLKVDESWQVVVAGSRSTRTHPVELVPPYTGKVLTDKQGAYQSSPPLVAVRTMGNGRVVLLAFGTLSTVYGYKHPFWEDIAMTGGDGSTPSDLLKLMDSPASNSRGG